MMALGRMVLAAGMLACAPVDARAQDACPSLSPTSTTAADSGGTPDVLIRARASIRELRFQSQPRTSVRTLGCALDGVEVTERVNLPDPVEPGVTYRDVRVGVEIRADFQVACLLPALAADPALAGLCAPAPSASAAPQPERSDAPAPATPPRR
jgi:hypothetical protein